MAERIQTMTVYMGLALVFGWVALASTSIPSQADTRRGIEMLVLGGKPTIVTEAATGAVPKSASFVGNARHGG